MSDLIYYDAVRKGVYWYGRHYKYDKSGNVVITVWTSAHPQQQENQAIDDAVIYADENGIEVVNGQ